jgi:hypothetical protein
VSAKFCSFLLLFSTYRFGNAERVTMSLKND